MLWALTLAAVVAADPPPPAPEENGAQVQHLGAPEQQSAESPAVLSPSSAPSASNDSRSASLREPTRKKSVSFILAGAELVAGALAGYLGLVVGIALNLPHGGLSFPPDSLDVVYLAVIPAVACAGLAWLAGLLDFSQRSIVGSALWAALGSIGGELVGLGLGSLVGRAIYPTDEGAAGIITIFFAPAVAALGCMLLMEIFKPGEEVYATLNTVKTRDGSLAFGPAVLMRF